MRTPPTILPALSLIFLPALICAQTLTTAIQTHTTTQTLTVTPPIPTPQKIHFTENRGQILSLEKQTPATDVLFKISAPGGDLYITSRGTSYVFSHRRSTAHNDIERVDVNFENARIRIDNATITYNNAQPPVNYYLPHGLQKLRPIQRVDIRNIYPGIDWIISIQKINDTPALKQDFVLHPGADLRRLRLRYSDNAAVEVDSAGAITIRSKLGRMTEAAPTAWEDQDHAARIPIKVTQRRNRVTYRLPDPLIKHLTVIDPQLFWGTALTSDLPGIDYNDNLVGNDVTTDANGNSYTLMTSTTGVSFPLLNPGNGAFFQDFANTTAGAMVIMKCNPNGQLLWSTFYGLRTSGSALATDPAGNLYAAGSNQQSGGIPIYINGVLNFSDDQGNFVTKFSPDGQLIWASGWDGIDVSVTRMACDSKSNLYLTGVANGPTRLQDAGGGAYYRSTFKSGIQGPFVTQFTSDGRIQWSTLIEGAANLNSPERLAIDAADNLYLCGDSIRCFNPSHQEIWSDATVGGPYLQDIACDRVGNVFVTGYGPGAIVKTDPGNGAFIDNTPSSGNSTGFIIKYAAGSHQIVWSTPFFNAAMTDVYRIVADRKCDAIHLAGYVNSFPDKVPTTDNSCNGDFYFSNTQFQTTFAPIFVTFSTGGRLIYCSLSNFPSNTYDNETISLAADPFGALYYLFGQVSPFAPIPAVKDPGNGAFIQTGPNNLMTSAFLMKLTPSKMNATLAVNPPPDCHCNSTAAVNILCGTPPYKYLWSTGDTTSATTGLCSGKYSVTVTDANCNDTTFSFSIAPAPGSVTGISATAANAHCNLNDGSITIAAVQGGAAPYSYALNTQPPQPIGSFFTLPPATYQLTVTDINGCTFNDTIQVQQVPGPDSIYISAAPAICGSNNASLQVDSAHNGTMPFQYSLNNGAFSATAAFKNLAPGNYWLQVKDSAGCLKGDSAVVAYIPPPSSAALTVSNALCGAPYGKLGIGHITGGTPPYAWSLDSIRFSTASSFDSLSPGRYAVYLRDSTGCSLKDSFRITSTAKTPFTLLPADTSVCYGAGITYTITPGAGPALTTYNWNAGPGNTTGPDLGPSLNLTAANSGYIIVAATNNQNCISTDTVLLDVRECDSLASGCLRFPGAFSPNNDGRNDWFGGIAHCPVTSYKLEVFDRHGQLIFISADLAKKWDGTINGTLQPAGNYVWVCEYSIGIQRETRSGSVILIR